MRLHFSLGACLGAVALYAAGAAFTLGHAAQLSWIMGMRHDGQRAMH